MMKMKTMTLLVTLSVLACGVSAGEPGKAATDSSSEAMLVAQDSSVPNLTESRYRKRGIIMDPVASAFVAKSEEGQSSDPITPEQFRKGLDALQSDYTMPADIEIEDRVLKVGPRGSTPIRIYRKKGVTGPAPSIVYMHGAGFVGGGVIAHARMVGELARCTEAVIIFVRYTLAPEATYPNAHDQCYAVLEYVHANPGEFSTTSDHISIAGDSVGGAMAASCSLRAKEEDGPEIRSQMLFYPAVNLDADALDYGKLLNGPWLSKENLEWAWTLYFANNENLKDPLISPYYASVEQLTEMPTTLVITGDNDVLHESGETYAKKLIEAGVSVTANRYFGTIHDFMMLNALSETPSARAARAEACFFYNDITH
ncbi:MAG: hypothetical protein CBC35_07215 [Planctomycetes bacterium TMED75]|nr:lipase [Planctomycetaceae bacterium]OUU92494.1 MAG: hypothetical protein CBC35_07215 [Planctomycetes bacterium TMED75]